MDISLALHIYCMYLFYQLAVIIISNSFQMLKLILQTLYGEHDLIVTGILLQKGQTALIKSTRQNSRRRKG